MPVMSLFYRIESETNRYVNIKLNAIMWNTVFKEHFQQYPHCDGFLEWDMSNEERWGMGNSESAICTKCPYKSKRFRLYNELNTGKRGRKAATVNVTLPAALSQTPIFSTSFRKINLRTNVPAPSVKGLQNRTNQVLPQIIEINKKDMKMRREQLIEINKLCGRTDPNAVSLKGDEAYNNPLYSGIGRTPFQPATQVVYAVVENETEDKSILAVIAKNKLCSTHPVNARTGKNDQCTEECSSNITFMKSIGDEYSWAKEALTDLKADGIEAKHFTTDHDSSAFKAAEDLYHEKVTQTEPVHFIDTRHLSQNHRKNIKKNQQILKMMPGKTKAERNKLINNFAVDLAARCEAEFSKSIQIYGGNFQKVKNKMSYVSDAIPFCYMGDHELCRRHSFVCHGRKKFWLANRSFLDSTFKIEKTVTNIKAIRNCVSYRLGPKAVQKQS